MTLEGASPLERDQGMQIQDQVAVAVAVSGVRAVAVAGLTKRLFNHIQKDFLINVWGYVAYQLVNLRIKYTVGSNNLLGLHRLLDPTSHCTNYGSD